MVENILAAGRMAVTMDMVFALGRTDVAIAVNGGMVWPTEMAEKCMRMERYGMMDSGWTMSRYATTE